ncbi:hypothetical protein [Lentzea guizhouensis]|uniref:hypothetical protein n=1 Tax=Lentzea guizhouensis TaxID=1586287 RepID=UPI0012B6A55B|nr:hypothetical protein [Lentzea guizhouensis]
MKRKAAVVTASALGALLLSGGIAFALASGGGDAPAGTEQLPTSSSSSTVSTTSSSSVAPTTPVAPTQAPMPVVPQQPATGNNGGMNAPQPPQNNPVPTETPPPGPTWTHEPVPSGETAAPPPPPAPCYWDDSDPVNFPNGREICP